MKAKTLVRVLLWGQAGFWGNILFFNEDNLINTISVWVMIISSIMLAFNFDKLKEK